MTTWTATLVNLTLTLRPIVQLPLVPDGQDFYFKMKGDYTFTIAQAMREDPLEYVMNVGLRIEKK